MTAVISHSAGSSVMLWLGPNPSTSGKRASLVQTSPESLWTRGDFPLVHTRSKIHRKRKRTRRRKEGREKEREKRRTRVFLPSPFFDLFSFNVSRLFSSRFQFFLHLLLYQLLVLMVFAFFFVPCRFCLFSSSSAAPTVKSLSVHNRSIPTHPDSNVISSTSEPTKNHESNLPLCSLTSRDANSLRTYTLLYVCSLQTSSK